MSSFLSGVTDLFGGTPQGAGFSASTAPIQQVVDPTQITRGYNTSIGGLDEQQALINALAAQNGIGNQNSVFNQQQQLANALQAQSMGQGPNPAQAALNQNTGNNIAAQAALMAGQRGASANVGLMARQIAQNGAGIQQNAIGQGATMQAQQQLAAQQQLQQQQASMAGLATNQVGQQVGAVGNLNQFAQNEQGMLNNAVSNYNNANVSNTGNMNSTNEAMASTNAGNSAKVITAGIGALGAAGANKASAYSGGLITEQGTYSGKSNPKMDMVPKEDRFAYGGEIPDHLKHIAAIYHADKMACGGMSKGGAVDTMVSPGEKYLRPDQVERFAKGDKSVVNKAKKIPGKAKVSGDSEINDTVKKKLDSGGVVIPRTKADSNDDSKNFVAALLNKYGDQQMGGGEEEFKSALKKAIAGRGKK